MWSQVFVLSQWGRCGDKTALCPTLTGAEDMLRGLTGGALDFSVAAAFLACGARAFACGTKQRCRLSAAVQCAPLGEAGAGTGWSGGGGTGQGALSGVRNTRLTLPYCESSCSTLVGFLRKCATALI